MTFDSIKPFEDSEVNQALRKQANHPFMQALMDYAFPTQDTFFHEKRISDCNSIYDFQGTIIYPALLRVLDETTSGLSTSGFDELDPSKSYLYISNHRDIVLDTSLTNMVLFEKGMNMTSSAIGDNLVQDPFLLTFSKLNRNFLVHRNLSPRELLMSSKNISSYISHLLHKNHRSVWLAQREGRTKDGNDQTQQGIIKMLTLAKPKDQSLVEYLRTLNIVPLSISYELDPTDYLKMPELLATYRNEEYVKTKNEDFNNILTGVLGKKRRIHISATKVLSEELDELAKEEISDKQYLKSITSHISNQIHQSYMLWPTNYMAHDILFGVKDFSDKYTVEDLAKFEDRVLRKTGGEDPLIMKSFLAMYAYPVLNKFDYEERKVILSEELQPISQ